MEITTIGADLAKNVIQIHRVNSHGNTVLRNRIEARVVIEDWRQHYNHVRPHSSLNYETLEAFSRKAYKDLSTEAIPN